MKKRNSVILMADDDADDVMLVRDAFTEAGWRNAFHSVEDGKELMAYLLRTGDYSEASQSPRPDLILLDLNMPKLHGKDALKEIKKAHDLRSIPVVILSTSNEEHNISECYCLGASAYIVKPTRFEELTQAARLISSFWFQLAEMPSAALPCPSL